MKFADWSFPNPAENLACDEVLLDRCEQGGEHVLRIWESPVTFIVVGYANRIETEVNAALCRDCGVPILRRCSGGGTVVQGPGCLNYSVVLRCDTEPELGNVTGTNKFVMHRNRAALQKVINAEVAVHGCTDLALRRGETWVKFSGNAQRRRRNAVLFHGTILYSANLAEISRLLRFPSVQPDYRMSRAHEEFVTNIAASRETITRVLREEWNAAEMLASSCENEVRTLALERYGSDAWNFAR